MVRSANPDLVYCQNNGVIAIKPTASGKLASFMLLTAAKQERVWVFRDVYRYMEGGNEVFDYKSKGLTVGVYKDAAAFFEMCRSLGLTVEAGSFYVPISNGQRAIGETDDCEVIFDHDKNDQILCRYDLPSRDELLKTLAWSGDL